MLYRREIDGLRAVAVLPVLFFHAGFELFSGGFVGVDVFFVISGYLITTIIIEQTAKERFSLADFYGRRARRILPLLFVVLAVAVAGSWLLLLPNEMAEFSRSLAAVSLLSSNFVFWKESGYFNTLAELKPLLHTWSLAVEEQYYLLFPLFLVLTRRVQRRKVAFAIFAIALGSFAIAQWGSIHKPWAAFFLLPSRAWEILLGSLAAFYVFDKGLPAGRQALSGLGVALILGAVFFFDRTTPFPGVYALAPTVGTVLVILWASPSTLVGRLLSQPIMVGVGLVSYGAYLWHQPLFVFARIKTGGELSTTTDLVLIAVTFPLAYITYRFVETPVRRKRILGSNSYYVLAAAVSAVFLAIGLMGHFGRGFPDRLNAVFPKDAREAEEAVRNGTLFDSDSKLPADERRARPTVLVLGDSHVGAWSFAFNRTVDHSKYRLLSLLYLGCDVEFPDGALKVSVAAWAPGHEKWCDPLAKYLGDPEVLASLEKIILVTYRPFEHSTHQFRFEFLEWLQARAPAAKIYVVGNYYQLKEPQTCLNLMFRSGRPASVCMEAADYPEDAQAHRHEPFFERMKVNYEYIDLIDLHCGYRKADCDYEVGHVPFMTDDNHLTRLFTLHLLEDLIRNQSAYLRTVGLDIFEPPAD